MSIEIAASSGTATRDGGQLSSTPSGEFKQQLPFRRWWQILLRTVHLITTSILVGGHYFEAAPSQLLPFLYGAVASGIVMTFVEAYPSVRGMYQGWSIALYAKLALLCAIPLYWDSRVAILIAVVTIAAIASHMPARFRHFDLAHYLSKAGILRH